MSNDIGQPANGAIPTAPGWRWRSFQIMFRWIVVALGAVVAAILIAGVLKSSKGWTLTISTSGIAIATIINFLPDLIALARNSNRYVRGQLDKWKDLTTGFWEAWATLTAIFASILLFGGSSLADPPLLVVYSNAISPPPPLEAIEMIPAFYKNSASSKNWKMGIDFTSEELDISVDKLARLVDALLECGSIQPGDPVELTVVGFASSKEFDEIQISDPEKKSIESKRLNVETANRRAWEAFRFLAKRANVTLQNPKEWTESYKWESRRPDPVESIWPAGAILVTVHQWEKTASGWEQMRAALPLNDRPSLSTQSRKIGREPEELDRRVQFDIVKGGACDKRRASSQ